ncbi:hypothetical protein PISL3812_02922 [Talaromyces islandicus]|uniref:Mid2 domain-containing protein n=1 Tax=Talaromyces islandicus TaxID=28573 RepID=A0A0U1LR88_TALIS|nr:hypothetical protein PISL3812_02922 [Talaromyces islandicus]
MRSSVVLAGVYLFAAAVSGTIVNDVVEERDLLSDLDAVNSPTASAPSATDTAPSETQGAHTSAVQTDTASPTSTDPASSSTSSDPPVSTSSSSTTTSSAPPSTTSSSSTSTTSSDPSTSSSTSTSEPATSTEPPTTSSTSSVPPETTTSSLPAGGVTTEVLTSTAQPDTPSSTSSAAPSASTTPGLNDSGSSASSGLSVGTRNTIIGVVVGVGGAILIAGIAFAIWRIWGRNRHESDNDEDDLMSAGTAVGSNSREKAPSPSGTPFRSTLDQYHNPGPVNAASNF